MADIVHNATAGVGQVLAQLSAFQGKLDQAEALVNMLGWELPPGVDDIGLTTLDIADLLTRINAVIAVPIEEQGDDILMAGRIAELAISVKAFAESLRALAQELPVELASAGDYIERTKIHEQLPVRLLDFSAMNYMQSRHPLTFAILHLINVLDYEYFPADPANFQVEHSRAIIRYGNFKLLFEDPAELMQQAYGWNTSRFLSFDLLQRLNLLFQALSMRNTLQPLNPKAEEVWLGRPVTDLELKKEVMPQLNTILHQELGSFTGFQLGLSLVGVRATTDGASDGGFGLVPIASGQAAASIPFFRFADTFVDLFGDIDVLRRVALILRPGQDLAFKTAQGASDKISGRLALGLRHGGPELDVKTVATFPGGSAIQMQQFHVIGGMEKYDQNPPDSFLEAGLLGGRFALSTEQADSFLTSAVPQKNISAPLDFRLRWTQQQGLHFQGSSGLSVNLPVHAEAGPFVVDSVTLGITAGPKEMSLLTALSGSVKLGPLTASIQSIGVEVDVGFEEGNLGFVDLSPKFKPPSGIGITVDGGGFKGGGFLSFEPDDDRYVGMLELEFRETIQLKAIGLLTTSLPGREDGFSLLIIITAEFQPMQLGMGFTLNGVGGLLGLNRTMRVDRLRAGVRDQTLSSILFPEDPVANANRIISDLRQVFPPQAGRFVFGPMAKIGWGTPTLITLEAGLALEVPEPITLALLGVLKAELPSKDKKLLQLKINFLGVIDFEKQQLSFDATIYESKLLEFPLSGDMAVRLCWGSTPNFLLSVGGFHPAYQPPPLGVPALRRLTVQLLDGDNPRLTLETYFAITSNTVQFGAKIDLYAKSGPFNVIGLLSFDTLFQFSPFYFVSDVKAMLALRRGSRSLASISLALTLEGTSPWQAKGTAKLKLCWFLTVKIRFNKTFGRAEDTRLDDIEVLPLLRQALEDPASWEALPPARRQRLVSLKESELPNGQLLADPFGVLSIQQKVAPLNVRLDTVGHQRPSDGNEFRITNVAVNGSALTTQATKEQFAPAQFFTRTDQEKLSGKSFEEYDSGIRLADTEKLVFDHAVNREVEYELSYIDSQREQVTPPRLMRPFGLAFTTWATRGAIAQSRLSKVTRPALAPAPVTLQQEAFAVVSTDDLSLVDGGSVRASENEANKLMQDLIASNPGLAGRLQTVPTFELN